MPFRCKIGFHKWTKVKDNFIDVSTCVRCKLVSRDEKLYALQQELFEKHICTLGHAHDQECADWTFFAVAKGLTPVIARNIAFKRSLSKRPDQRLDP